MSRDDMLTTLSAIALNMEAVLAELRRPDLRRRATDAIESNIDWQLRRLHEVLDAMRKEVTP